MGDELLQRVKIVPIDIEVVCNVLGNDARIINLLRPRGDAVIKSVDKDDLFLMSVRARSHDGGGGDIVAVLCEKRPVSRGDGINH